MYPNSQKLESEKAVKFFSPLFTAYRAFFVGLYLHHVDKNMTKDINHNPYKNHRKVYSTQGQRISPNGKWLTMADGSRFKRTKLPSVATGQVEKQETLLEELAEDDVVIRER